MQLLGARTSAPMSRNGSDACRRARASRAHPTPPSGQQRKPRIRWRWGGIKGLGKNPIYPTFQTMHVRLITLRYSPSLGGFDTTAVDEFLRGRELLSFREHFFHVNDVPHLTCILSVLDALVPATARVDEPPSVGRSSDSSAIPIPRPCSRGPMREVESSVPLSELQRTRYGQLRNWRYETSRREGVPPFVILTNRELTEIVVRDPDSLTALGNIPGIGPAKIKRHGAAILSLLGVAPKEARQSPAKGVAAGTAPSADGRSFGSEEPSSGASQDAEAGVLVSGGATDSWPVEATQVLAGCDLRT